MPCVIRKALAEASRKGGLDSLHVKVRDVTERRRSEMRSSFSALLGIYTLTAGSAERRLAVFLLDYEQDGVFIPPCPMNRLAELLGIGRASLYRAIDALCAEGLIEKQGKNIHLRNKDALLRLI